MTQNCTDQFRNNVQYVLLSAKKNSIESSQSSINLTSNKWKCAVYFGPPGTRARVFTTRDANKRLRFYELIKLPATITTAGRTASAIFEK